MTTAPGSLDFAPIAKAILDQLSSQVGLATALATAICGGLVALVIQLAIHNRSGNARIALSGRWLIVLALLSEVVSLVFGYLARGAITDVAPVLMRLPATHWEITSGGHATILRFAGVTFEGSWQLKMYVAVQSIGMFLGIVFSAILALSNLRTLLPGHEDAT